MNIGLYFGSFNPIHIGHLILANAVVEVSGADQVWFVVSPHNPFKKKKSLLHEFDRLEMVRLAIADNPKLDVTDIEFQLPKPGYTIDTLTHIQERFPDYSFSIIMGEDNLSHLHKWKNYEAILEYYDILVYPRPSVPEHNLKNHPKVHFIDAPLMAFSATYIRKCVEEGHSIKYLVHEDVESFIHGNQFYYPEIHE